MTVVKSKHGELTLEEIADGLPGTGEVMASVSHCFGTCWHAARAEKWELAAYYGRRVRGQLRALMVRRPKYRDQMAEFLETGIEPLLRSLGRHDLAEFEELYARCVEMTNRYHVETGHSYIVWSTPAQSPEKGLGLDSREG